MTDRTIRSAINAAAAQVCEQRTPCLSCRYAARDIILAFLDGVPEPLTAIPPLELRLKVSILGADA